MGYKMKGPSLYPKITRTGYRKNSPDVNNKQNIIPGNEISMKEENGKPLEKGKIKGEGLTTGNTKIMKPGKDYKFPGDKAVLETPLPNKSLTKVVKELKGAVKSHARQAKVIEDHIDDMTPAKMHKGKPHWKSKSKWRKDGTLKKVVTKSNRGSGNPEHKGVFSGGRYKSVIKFDETGRIESAKNNRTKNKHKSDSRRLSKAKWIKRDMTPYDDMYTVEKKKTSKKRKKTRDELYNR